MTGLHSGAIAKIKEVSHKGLLFTHCIFKSGTPGIKKAVSGIKGVLNNPVKIVNAIRIRPLNSRLFQSLFESTDSLHEFLHAEVRWLSRGRVLSRLFELREETKIVLEEINSSLAVFLLDEMLSCKLAYLYDIQSNLGFRTSRSSNNSVFKQKI